MKALVMLITLSLVFAGISPTAGTCSCPHMQSSQTTSGMPCHKPEQQAKHDCSDCQCDCAVTGKLAVLPSTAFLQAEPHFLRSELRNIAFTDTRPAIPLSPPRPAIA